MKQGSYKAEHLQVRDGSIHWKLNYSQAIQDWKLESLSIFLDLLYSSKVDGVGVDKLYWRPSTHKEFEVRSYYYSVLAPSEANYLPWKSIWKPKVPTKVTFFIWVAALGNISTVENLSKCNIILVRWCCTCMCKKDKEIVDHLLLHCPIVREQ